MNDAIVYRCLLPTGWYVGITKKTLAVRKRLHIYATPRAYLKFHLALALEKDQAVWEVVAVCTWELAKIIEMDLIRSYKNILTGICYNSTDGGEGVSGINFPEATRKRMSESHRGITLSDESRKKLSESKKNGYHPLRGKKMPTEWRNKIVAACTGRKNTDATKQTMSEAAKKRWANKPSGFFDVFKIDGTYVGRWSNQRVCADSLNLKQSGIGNCLCGSAKTYHGYIFKRVVNASSTPTSTV